MLRSATILILLATGPLAAQDNLVRTVAGNGQKARSGDGGPATQAGVGGPFGVVIGPDKALYICETLNHCVRRVDLSTGTIITVAGSGEKGYSGDGGPATSARCNEPYEVRFDMAGNMYFVEMQNHLVRKVDAKTKTISTLAGTGMPGFSGDGGPAVQAQFRQPHSIALKGDDELYIADIGNHRVRRVRLSTGVVETWSGTGEKKLTPDGAPVTGTPLNGPRAIDFRGSQMWLALREGNAVYRVDEDDTWRHVAGVGGKAAYAGDGGLAAKAVLAGPKGIALDKAGNVYLADTESHTVRVIRANDARIHTVVGDGQRGDGPDGPAFKCRLDRPHGVYVSDDNVLYIGDSNNNRVRVLQLP
jgi:DNA-binding beta-propeller fold protein YncE